MDEYIVKHLLKKNKNLSKSDAEKRAAKIWDAYCEANKERDKKREKNLKRNGTGLYNLKMMRLRLNTCQKMNY